MMGFEIGAFITGKLADAVSGLAKTTLGTNKHVIRFLKNLGYEHLEDKFDCLYVHALVQRWHDGMPEAMLTLFEHDFLVRAFHRAWVSGDVDALASYSEWAASVLQAGKEVQAQGINAEEEIRLFYKTFDEFVTKASSPAALRTDRRIVDMGAQVADIYKVLMGEETPGVVPTEAQRFRRDLPEWLEACGYVIEKEPSPLEDDYTFDMVVSLRRRREPGSDRYFVRGLAHVADAGNFHDLPNPQDAGAAESWLVASVEASEDARKAAQEGEDNRFVFTLDDLIDEVVRFEKYEEYLEDQISSRKLTDYYVPLACRKPELDRQGVTHGETKRDALQGYVDWWLEQPLYEHVSILGEFGMGKTWFTLRLAHDHLRAYRNARAKKRRRGRYPLLIQLRDYAKAVSADSLLSEFFFNRFETGLPSMKAFKVLNRMGRFLLIFDGFDEMARKVEYQKVIDNFWELAKVVEPGAKAVLTCRDEHFRYAREAREVFAGEKMASTSNLVLIPPRFEVVHIEPFDADRIRQAIINRLGGESGEKTAEMILSRPALANLVKRPVMIEMVLDSLADIAGRESLTESEIYLFATDRQMRKNITEERTFTSMTDKVLFLCELAWEMHRSGELTINYKRFPDRIKEIFGDRVKEAEIDHWWFDMMGQSLLVRDEDGNYSFAHRGLVEYFAAYRLLARVDALGAEYVDRYRDEETGQSPAEELKQRAGVAPLDCWGSAPFHPNLITFLAEMAAGKEPLMQLIEWTKGKTEDKTGYVGGNAATVLGRIDPAAFVKADLRGASLRQAQLQGTRLRGVKAAGADLRDADLMAADLTEGSFSKARLDGARLVGLNTTGTVACDPSGELLFGGPTSGGWVYDLQTRRFLDIYGSPSDNWTCDRAVSDDARWLLHAEEERIRVGQVDRAAGTVKWDFPEAPAGTALFSGVAWHPQGWFLVLGWELGVLRVDPGSPSRVTVLKELPFEIGSGPGVIVRPPWWIVGGIQNTTVWDEQQQQRVLATFPARGYAGERPEVSPSGDRVSIANDKRLFIFNTARWKEVGHVEANSGCCTHGWSPTGEYVAVCNADESEVLVVRSDTVSIDSRLKIPRGPRGVAFHGPDELVVVDAVGTIRLYDRKTGELIHSAPQIPLCEGADLRGATGLDAATREALENAGAHV